MLIFLWAEFWSLVQDLILNNNAKIEIGIARTRNFEIQSGSKSSIQIIIFYTMLSPRIADINSLASFHGSIYHIPSSWEVEFGFVCAVWLG